MTVAQLNLVELQLGDTEEDATTEEALLDGPWFEALSVGEFVDMWGREVIVELEDMPTFLQNTLDNIEATRSERTGIIGGLPIDTSDHTGGEAAGWIVDAALSKGNNIMIVKPMWTELGTDLIKSGKMKYFSPTFNDKKHTVLGGSLTNWPATRDELGKQILKPVELSGKGMEAVQQTINALSENINKAFQSVINEFKEERDNHEGVNMETPVVSLADLSEEQKHQLGLAVMQEATGETSPDVTDLSEHFAQQVELAANKKIAAELKMQQEQAEIAQFAKDITEGTEKSPVGLTVGEEKLIAFLSKLDEDTRKEAMEIFEGIQAVDFSEKGHEKELEDLIELPEDVQEKLDSGELELEHLKMPALGLGELEKYNLSKWQGKE